MSINWITALKLIPWADVVQAAPSVVRGAKDLWSRTRKANQANQTHKQTNKQTDEPAPATSVQANADAIRQLTERISQLESEQEDASALINTLAQQNAQLIVVLDQLRRRLKMCFAFSVLIALGGVALWLR